MKSETQMVDETGVSVVVKVSGGCRHMFVEWRPENPEAVELAISIACNHAASGCEFRGISLGENGEQQLWLVHPQRTRNNHPTH